MADLPMSATKYQLYQRCPLRFRFKYVDGLGEEESPAMQLGTMVHQVLEDHPNDHTKQVERLKEIWHLGGLEDDDQQLQYFKKAQVMLENYESWQYNTKNKIISTEKEWEMDVNGIHLSGRIDRVEMTPEGEYELVDYKTGKTPLTRNTIKRDLQVVVYANAIKHIYGKYPVKITLLYLQLNRAVTCKIEDVQFDLAQMTMDNIDDMVKHDEFPAKPGYHCGWCDFARFCEAGQKVMSISKLS